MPDICTRLAALFACLICLTACTASRVAPTGFDATPRLAVISAFDGELEKLRAAAQIDEVRVINGRSHYLGKLAGHDVVLFLCGFSMTNAAMSTQAVLDRFQVSGIVFSGIAGGVNPELQVGDVAVPAAWGNYQEQTLARETPGGWDPGRFKGDFANFGMIFPRMVSVTRRDAQPDQLERRFWFQANEDGLDTVRRLARDIKLQRCLPSGECLSHEPRLVVGGKGVSGPSFVDNAAYRRWAWDTFHADALDMETAAVALVAYVNRVPYIAFRSLSDLAGGGSGENEAKLFGRLAADNSATVVIEYLKAFGRAGHDAGGK
jgi:adenosylhomocysteine nucleosidase